MEQASRGPQEATPARPELAFFQDLFPLLFANAVDGICLTTTDGRVYAANAAACRIFGRSEEEICRLGRDALLNLGDPRLAPAMEDRRRTGRSQAELTVLRPDGTLVSVELTSTVLGEPGGDSPAVIVFRDVSERVHDREALASERALLDRVFESLWDAVLVSDVRHRRVLRANAAVERILGWSPRELVGRETREIYRTTAEYEEAGRRAREAWAARGFYSDETELRHKDGSAVPVRFFARPAPGAGADLAVVVLHDLREERRAAAERERLVTAMFQAQKLEGLGTLTGGLAHELNNLLVPILANTSALAAAVPADDPRHHALGDVVASARQAAKLVAQLLAYTGKSAGAHEGVDLAAELRERGELLRASIPKNVSLRFEAPPEPVPVLGDAGQLAQVVLNLVVNAAEALGERAGQVAVRAGLERCGDGHPALGLVQPPLAPGSYAWVEVADDGPGMSADVAARALDPFFTTKGFGRGLGLAAASGIVRAHRGALELDTAPGRGTRARAWIPAAPSPAAAAAPPAPAPAPARAGGGRVLVVDDEPLVRRTARRLLEKAGYEVVEAGDGAEALERFQASPSSFDAVLLDLSMPRMSGDEAFAGLRRVRADVPVVLSSGYAPDERLERLLRDPRVRFASKPYDRRALVEAVAAAMGRDPAQS
jgi:two-component system cell cycle sensor histidine kinase/response regulator CckA